METCKLWTSVEHRGLKDCCQGLRSDYQSLKNLYQPLRNDPQCLKNYTQRLKNHSQLLKNRSQGLKNHCQRLRNDSQGLKSHCQCLKNCSQSPVNDSQRQRRCSCLLRHGSKVVAHRPGFYLIFNGWWCRGRRSASPTYFTLAVVWYIIKGDENGTQGYCW